MGIVWENTTTELSCDFCAGIGQLQLGVVLVSIKFSWFQVLQSDGGNYCASVNAATLALMDAGIPMKDYVIACAGSYTKETPIIDINRLEESSGGAEVIMAILPRCDQVSRSAIL